MKKGYLSPFHQGSLSAISEALTIAAKHTKERATNSDAIFYATAFQAGVDEFLVHENTRDKVTTRSSFIAYRTKSFSNNRSSSHFDIITNAFSVYLPDDWQTSLAFHPVICTAIFINDLLDAMSAGASLLSTGRLPDLVEIKELMPDELFVPLSTLLSTFTAVQTPSPIPQNALLRDDIQKFNEILSGDLFSKYVNSQSSLDDSGIPIEKTLPVIASDGRMLFSQNRNLLALRNASVNILQMTPKLVEAVFGKLPGALAEVAVKLGISFLEERRRLVIYDFHELMYEEVLMPNLVRMLIKATDAEEGSG